MRPFTLTAPKTGISRLRTKGGARPDSMFDLVNAQFNAAREFIPRPGSLIYDEIGTSVPTKGLAFFRGRYHVFAVSYSAVTSTNGDTVLHVLPHPLNGQVGAPALKEIHLAEPFLGYLFIVAEFANGDVYYFWLTEGDDGGVAWEANKVYALGDVVRPTSPNGFYYRATRLTPPGSIWEAGKAYQVGDVVEPSEYNGFEYEAVDVAGTNPRSGATEPEWIADDGALVYDDADTSPAGGGSQSGGSGAVPPAVPPRYGGGAGSYGDGFQTQVQ